MRSPLMDRFAIGVETQQLDLEERSAAASQVQACSLLLAAPAIEDELYLAIISPHFIQSICGCC